MNPAPFHQLPGDTLPPATAFWVEAEDGVRLRLALWKPSSTNGRANPGTVLLFPGRTEYIEKYAQVAALLNQQGFTVLSIDWRGQGMSDRLQADPLPGHVKDFADYQLDVVEMVVTATDLDLPQPWNLLGHSMGGCIGLAALHNDLPVETAAFSAPMWGIVLHRVPRPVALGLSGVARRLGRGGNSVYTGKGGTYVLDVSFSRNLLTGDIHSWTRLMNEAVAWPELKVGAASFDWLTQGLAECRRLAALPSPDLPMLASVSDGEFVVSQAAIRDRVSRWNGAELLEFTDARHEILFEAPHLRDQFLAAAMDLFRAGQ